ncbi:MAG TPA: Trk system potassium transporter TrkA [Desulfobacteraceae bacterium]|nr:Trk system potassium transporter TrkA [Desulfobacteraceae bacterium]
MKIIIVGAGEVGFHIAKRLSEESNEVVLIDKDEDKINRINENLDVYALLGSGTSPQMLKSSGIAQADMLIAATDSDEVNLIASMLACHLNPSIIKVVRLRNQEYIREEGLLNKDLLGIDQIINPESFMVDTIKNLIMVPGASDVIDFDDGRVKLIGITIKPDSEFVGRRFNTFSEHHEKFLVGAIIRGDQVFIPHGEDTIQANDLIYVVARSDDLNGILGRLHVEHRECKRIFIIGGGQVGFTLAQSLDNTNLNVKIIEKDSRICNSLADRLQKVIVINGDGTDKDLLLEENIADADIVLAITGDDETNVLISLLAKRLGVKKTITRINKLSYIPLVFAIGIDTVVSRRLSAIRAILQYVRKGKIISVAPLKGEHAEAIEAEALAGSNIVNRPLCKVKFPKGSIVGAIVRGDDVIIPNGQSIIQEKDRLIIFALQNVIPKLERLLTMHLD